MFQYIGKLTSLLTYIFSCFLESNKNLTSYCTSSWQLKDVLRTLPITVEHSESLYKLCESPTWHADGRYQVQCNTAGQYFSHTSSGCVLLVSSLSMSGSLFHLTVFHWSTKHKENRQRWGGGAPGDLMHIDVWTRFSSYSCQKLSLECESAPTSLHCTTVNKETAVWECSDHAALNQGYYLEQSQHPMMPLD